MKHFKVIVFTFFALCVSSVFAGNVALEKYAKIYSTFEQKFPDEKIVGVRATPLKGIYEIMIPPHVYYSNIDASYVFRGDIFKMSNQINITQNRRKVARRKAIELVDEDTMIEFKAAKPRYTVSVFTDTDCVYCRKLHSQMAEYNNRGITVRYLAFPRGGKHSASFAKSNAVWCAKDRQKAITNAKNDVAIEKVDCESPVLKHYNLGKKFGIQGTPAIVLDDGDMIPGYVSPERLLAELEKRKKTLNMARQ